MKYVLAPPILAKSPNAAMKMNAALTASSYSSKLSPIATQWLLNVTISMNRCPAPFDVVENLLRSFLAGAFCTEHSMQMFEQTSQGFAVVFAPEMAELNGSHRPEVQRVDIHMEFVHVLMSQETLFTELLQLSDYGFTSAIGTMISIAPLVFNKYKRERLAALAPLLRPIALSLRLDLKSAALESMCERGLPDHEPCASRPKTARTFGGFPDEVPGGVSGRASEQSLRAARIAAQASLALMNPRLRPLELNRARKPHVRCPKIWHPNGLFFEKRVYEHRQFIVLTDYGVDTHHPFFLNTLT